MFHRKYKTPLFVILSVELNLAVHDALDLPGAVREVGAEDAAVVGRVEVAVEGGGRVEEGDLGLAGKIYSFIDEWESFCLNEESIT